VRLAWGTETVNLDYVTIDREVSNSKQYCRSYRNMVVLRHKASEPKILHVYYVAPNLDTTRSAPYGSNIGLPSEQNASSSHIELTWPSSNQINTPLVLGGIYNSAETSLVDNV